MVTVCPNLVADSPGLWNKYFLAKLKNKMWLWKSSAAEWSFCQCQNVYWGGESIPFTYALPPHKCLFCPVCKINSKNRPDFIPGFISLDIIWQIFVSNVFFNKNKPLKSDDMNSWVERWLGHTLPKAAGWALWPL